MIIGSNGDRLVSLVVWCNNWVDDVGDIVLIRVDDIGWRDDEVVSGCIGGGVGGSGKEGDEIIPRGGGGVGDDECWCWYRAGKVTMMGGEGEGGIIGEEAATFWCGKKNKRKTK